ncbi:MAG TPA: hypothetical protein VG205_04900 [Acidimicrobiales bacterium]|nr:hypothetical protein [Acidimicrobiales bacterium]
MVTSPLPLRRSGPLPGHRHDAVPHPGGAPAVAIWSDPLLAACAAAAGSELTYAEGPTPLDQAQGAWAFGFRLQGGPATSGSALPDPDDPWGVSLVVRLADDRGTLEREAAAMRLSRSHGLGSPAVRQIVPLETGDGSGTLWALITEVVDGVALPELIGFNLHQSDDLLSGFAAHHLAIHRLPAGELGADQPIPVIVDAAEVARIDPDRFPGERNWLDEHLPAPAVAGLCHGGYQPMCVFGPPPAAWADHGGAGKGLTVANWSGAVLAPPEFDVAFTLVAFWSAPFFAKNRAERAAIKMIRNTLLNTYTLGYTGELDPDRVRFWRAFHAARGLARLGGGYDAAGSPFGPLDRGPLPDELGPELQRHFRQITRMR